MRTGDYTNTNFYRLVCKDITITDEYIGHTTKFRERKYYHKKACCNKNDKGYNSKVYQFIRTNGGWDNWEMVLIEIKSFNNVLEARAYERHLIETRKATLNTNIPNRSIEEYKEANREQILEKKKAHREANREQILEQKKAHMEANREQILEQRKAYREANREQILEKKKAYREANREQILEKKKAYREAHKAEIKAYRDAHKEEIKAYNKARREAKKAEKNI